VPLFDGVVVPDKTKNKVTKREEKGSFEIGIDFDFEVDIGGEEK
jgi:hypothetical protein